MEIRNVTIVFPNIFTPKEFNGTQKYGFAFRASSIVADILAEKHIYPKSTNEGVIFNVSSKFPPIINDIDEDYETLVKVMQIAEARNYPKDRLFREIQSDIDVDIYEYETSTTQGRALAVNGLSVSSKAMLEAVVQWHPKS